MAGEEAKAPQGGGEGLSTIVEMGGDSKNPFSSMVAGVSSAFAKMQEMLPGEGVKPELVHKLAALDDQYKALLQEIMASMSGGSPAPSGRPVDAVGGTGGIPMPS